MRVRKLGLPQESREAFALLEKAGVLDGELSVRLQAMVGFRNVAVHDDQKLNLEIVKSILEEGLQAFRRFCGVLTRTA
ncbi:type VII toxin-antitoxin system HepT family RNase toxin [Geoalkalibacter subterraneus]|uniref:type VII toxin-antitoxin system HepT family RNase toxin n=1 Tax=Geoalkalibacter subterraneus TaxID=483547 RepID=UPI00190F5B00|nr:DUF86 domain-containing protein [Geoalkalibacter subterraneus]